MRDGTRLSALRELLQRLETLEPSADGERLMRSIRDRIVQLEAGPQTGIRWAESGAKALEHDPPAPSPAAAASEPSPHVSHYEGDDMDPSALLPADSDPLEFA